MRDDILFEVFLYSIVHCENFGDEQRLAAFDDFIEQAKEMLSIKFDETKTSKVIQWIKEVQEISS